MKKYAMIQIDAEIHQLLKDFCKEKGYKINGLVETLIKANLLIHNESTFLRCELSFLCEKFHKPSDVEY